MSRYRLAQAAIQGGRDYQEDSALVIEPASHRCGWLACVLADGMGGHQGGALASTIICDAFLACIEDGSLEPSDGLLKALGVANDAVARRVRIDPMLNGMGATLVGVVVEEDALSWVSVGDSPLYLVRRGEIARLNADHSMAPILARLVVAGEITAEDAEGDPRRHHLRSAVMGDDLELIDASRRPLRLEAGDCVLVASDGIHTLSEARIAAIVGDSLARGPEAVVQGLIAAVERAAHPFQDNTTLVAILVTE